MTRGAMGANLTVTASDVIARRPCADWAARIPAVCERYRRARWSALDILALDADGYARKA